MTYDCAGTKGIGMFTIPAHDDDGDWVRQDTRAKPLTVPEKVQLAVLLHLLGPSGRLFLHIMDVCCSATCTNKNGDPILKVRESS